MSSLEPYLPPEAATAQFIEKITKADGELLPLPGKRSKLGESFYISARLGEDAWLPDSHKRYMNVDVFVKRGKDFVPIGIYDWEITGEEANGNKQRHQHLPCVNEAHENADSFWSTGEAFHVIDTDFLKYAADHGGFKMMDQMREGGVITSEEQWGKPIYQGEGLGSLMIAVSILTLNKNGIDKMELGSLTDSAERAWKKFDVGDTTQLRTQDLLEHPMIMESIKKFVVE